MSSLTTVTVTFDFVMVTDDGFNLEGKAREWIQEATGDMGTEQFNVSTRPYAPGNADYWDGQCIPYGGDSRTTDKYLEEIQA